MSDKQFTILSLLGGVEAIMWQIFVPLCCQERSKSGVTLCIYCELILPLSKRYRCFGLL